MCQELLGRGWEVIALERLFQLRLPPGRALTFKDFATGRIAQEAL